MKYFRDANIIIDILNGNRKTLLNISSHTDDIIRIPDISYYEVMRGFEYRPDMKKLSRFDVFCDSFGIEYQTRFSLDVAARNYASLRKTGQTIEDDDLLIGSLAIAENAVLVTNNTEHLSRLKGIQLENWAV